MKINPILLKEIIRQCEIARIKGVTLTYYDLKQRLFMSDTDPVIKTAINNGYLNNNLHPTDKGRELIKVGLTGGTFDIIHIGHLKTLYEAKKHVDILAVVVARDKTVKKLKNREPLNNEEIRLQIVSMLRPVDVAILGSETDFMEPVYRIKPDIIFLGYDQDLPPSIKDRLKEIEIKRLEVYYRGYKTSKMVKKLLEMMGY
jgi:FAD synthetase